MLHQIIGYWCKPLSLACPGQWRNEMKLNRTRQLVTVSFLGALAAVLQAAGGWMPGPGFLISPLSTAPVIVSSLLSIRSGVIAYVLTSALLLVIQPTELFVFPFTTGLLGLGIGVGLTFFNNRISVTFCSGLLLLAGIALLLYVVRFPVLGPEVGATFRLDTVGYLFLFCMLYSVFWMEISMRLLSRLFRDSPG